MAELLEFIFRDPATFIGTVALIGFTGVSINVALSPFGRPKTINFYGREEEDDNKD